MKQLILLALLLILMPKVQAKLINCSEDTVIEIQNSSLSNNGKDEELGLLREQCLQYHRVSYAASADMYFSKKDYARAVYFFTKAYRSKSGNDPINNNEMRAKYALALHYENKRPIKSAEIFLELRDKYKNKLPVKINELYTTYKISLSKQIVSHETMTGVLLSTKSYKNLKICPAINVTIQFGYNSSQISTKSEQQIKEIELSMKQMEEIDSHIKFEVIGHTDKQGSRAYNQGLSERRAEAVKNALVSINPALKFQLSSLGKGENKPELSGDSEEIYRVNRRVEIRIPCEN